MDHGKTTEHADEGRLPSARKVDELSPRHVTRPAPKRLRRSAVFGDNGVGGLEPDNRKEPEATAQVGLDRDAVAAMQHQPGNGGGRHAPRPEGGTGDEIKEPAPAQGRSECRAAATALEQEVREWVPAADTLLIRICSARPR